MAELGFGKRAHDERHSLVHAPSVQDDLETRTVTLIIDDCRIDIQIRAQYLVKYAP